MKKGIFGGTFDPIHNGHLHIAYEALYRLKLDEIIFLPNGNPPHKKGKKITDGEKRLKLIKEAIKDEKKFKVSEYEVHKKEFSYTYETLRYFNKLEPSTEWYFITGMDCLMDINSWKNVDEILSRCKFVVFSRSGYKENEIHIQKNNVEKKYNKELILLSMPLLDISSTLIREKVRRGENISYLIPGRIDNILKEMKLYY